MHIIHLHAIHVAWDYPCNKFESWSNAISVASAVSTMQQTGAPLAISYDSSSVKSAWVASQEALVLGL